MTWEQVREIDKIKVGNRKLFTIGGHTKSHPVLPTLSREEQEIEIVGSLERIQRELNQEELPKYFSHPEGKFNEDTISVLKSAGVIASPTATSGINTQGADLYGGIFRNMVGFMGEPMFRLDRNIRQYFFMNNPSRARRSIRSSRTH